jgi:hydrogenase maturation protease
MIVGGKDMLTREQIMDSLRVIRAPNTRGITELNIIREVTISNHQVRIILTSTGLSAGIQEQIESDIKNALQKINGVNEIAIEFIGAKPTELNKISNIIAVMSGKGGVGKSLVSALLAVALKRQGHEVGILDADITGPSIPKMFGVTDRPGGSESGLLPVVSRSGIELMSINLLLPSEDEAVIWRGPLIGRAITQFWEEVIWGKLDYLVVDLSPGTADAPLTVMQKIPITGVVIVLTPQDLTTMIVKKAVHMAQQMNKSVIGIVENMSYLYVPEIDKRIELFGRSRGEEMAIAAHAPLLGQIPIDPDLARLGDEGNIEHYNAEIVTKLGESIAGVTTAVTLSK